MKEKRHSQLRHQMINGKEYKIEKMNFARDNIPRSGFLKLGTTLSCWITLQTTRNNNITPIIEWTQTTTCDAIVLAILLLNGRSNSIGTNVPKTQKKKKSVRCSYPLDSFITIKDFPT